MHEDTNATTSTPDRLDTLVDQLTLAEQVALLAGADFWTTVPIPRLNIPASSWGSRGCGRLP